MEDAQILQLYQNRNQAAILETDQKYGAYCHTISMNLLGIREDAEECVNDTYHAAWIRIPPEQPQSLRAFLGRIVRNLSISRFRSNRAQKRFLPVGMLLAELDECIPDPHTVEETTELHELSKTISRWLDGLTPEDRTLFVRRYWYGDAVQDLAHQRCCTLNSLALRLHRLRRRLKQYLEAENL